MQRVYMAAMSLNVTETSAIILDRLSEDVISVQLRAYAAGPASASRVTPAREKDP